MSLLYIMTSCLSLRALNSFIICALLLLLVIVHLTTLILYDQLQG